MKEVHIEKISSVDSEDDLDTDEGDRRTGRFTLRLHNDKQPSTSSIYLLIDTKQDHVSILMPTISNKHFRTGSRSQSLVSIFQCDCHPNCILGLHLPNLAFSRLSVLTVNKQNLSIKNGQSTNDATPSENLSNQLPFN